MDKSRNLSCQGKPGKELKKRTKESRQTPERGPRRLGRRIRGQRGMFRTHLVRLSSLVLVHCVFLSSCCLQGRTVGTTGIDRSSSSSISLTSNFVTFPSSTFRGGVLLS
ncbi:uncharacterized protein ACWYII_045175 isoform 1-T1 [Salvelinus alpinus]